MIALLALASASAQDVSVTTLGTQLVRAESINQSDPDLLFGQRLRWWLGGATTLNVDGRFTFDPNGATSFEQSRVRSLGVTVDTPAYTLRLGRHALLHGGARIVDGAQLHVHPGKDGRWDVGLYAGFLADPFTTLPQMRPTFGPTIALKSSLVSASWLGEVVLAPGTDQGWERIGTVVNVAANLAPRASGLARADVLVRDSEGRSGLIDAAVGGRLRITDGLSWTADYNAYSSLRYQFQGAFDPTVRRFTQRVRDLDLQNAVLADTLDPTVQHMVGTALRLEPTKGRGLLAAVSARTRFHPDPVQRMTRINPMLGVRGLVDGRLEVVGDVAASSVEGRLLGDAGVTAVLELFGDRNVLVDSSFRGLVDPRGYGPGQLGWYSDVFVDVLLPSRTAIAAGATWTLEPSDAVGSDVGWGAFLRLQQWVKRK